jgi:beta-lactam-binding protein with PASTA domain
MTARSALRRSLPYAVAIVGGFLVAYLVVAFAVFPSGFVPGNAKVPNVTGLQYEDASRRLAADGFKASRGDERYREATPMGTVLSQDPPAGTKEPEGSSVTLTVSTNTVPQWPK